MTTTHFEETQGAELTTLEDEAALLTELEATGRVTVRVLGHSTRLEKPIRLVTVETDTTPEDAPTILFVGLQHGNEPIGREMLLSTIRDLAESTDPDLLDLMGRARMCFIPTANPSSFPDHRPVWGAGGADMNREHLSLSVVESEHVQRAITDLRPEVIIDCHEHFAPGTVIPRVEFLPGRHPASHPNITAVAEEMLAHVEDRLDTQGIDYAPYPGVSENPWVLRNMAAIRGAALMLVETPAREDIIPRWTRYGWYQEVVDSLLEWARVHISDAADRIMAGRQEMAISTGPLTLGDGWVLDPRPVAYELPTPGPHHLDVFGLDYTTTGDTVRVPMGQDQAPLVAYLLDADSPEPVMVSTRIAPEPPVPVPEPGPNPTLPTTKLLGYRVRVDGNTRDVIGIRHHTGGITRDVLMPS